MRQIFDELDQRSSEVDHLTLEHRICNRSSERAQSGAIDRSEWHNFLGHLGSEDPPRRRRACRGFRQQQAALRYLKTRIENHFHTESTDKSHLPSLSTQLLLRDTFFLTIYELYCLL